MSDEPPPTEYLVISRGRWDADASPQRIQAAIDAFYAWHARMVGDGHMRPGQRLMPEGKRVTRQAVTDGPYAEAKEVIGGYWFVHARSLAEAAELLRDSPCLACGLEYEIRAIDPERCSAFVVTSETPAR
ncbi:YciI family protein [Solimonas soli]|uniref:YciI family protein n=1 Tax=Solimonas soli TaxID=413479 RepID=UPI00048020EE|nr:YciI family protein [Solimonas soli]